MGRSSFYTIAACAAGSLLVFQTCLNVFGSVDLLPLTGVTFPFVSNGGLRPDVRLGASGLSEGYGHPGKRQLCHPKGTAAADHGGSRRRAEPIGDPFGQEEEADHEKD